jgi:hypothetical protein
MVAAQHRRSRLRALALTLALASLSFLPGILAARQGERAELLDRFAITVGASWVESETALRLDSEVLGLGTEIDFEEDLDFDASHVVPGVALELQLARRHQLSASWSDLDRESSLALRRDIQFGDRVFPIDVDVEARLDITDYRLGYTYWPVRGERSAFGVGVGLRVLELRAALEVSQLGLFEDGDATGPLPFLRVEYRHGLGSRARLLAQLGVLAVEIDDVSGEQVLASLGAEHLTFEHLGFGAAVSLSRIDVDTEESGFRGAVELDSLELSFFSRLRW